jgi:SAM-dependent methyltransferase
LACVAEGALDVADQHEADDTLDAIAPFDDARSAQQVDWVMQFCAGRRVFDAGCGHGRLAAPLAAAGIEVVAMDADATALLACSAAAPKATCVAGDFRSCGDELGVFDVVLCLGNTFALVHDVDEACATMRRWADMLTPGGVILLDDMPQDLWPELAEGNWRAGVSPAGQQLVWAVDDAVFALRSGEAVDPDGAPPGEGDRCLRLWTMGALRLLAVAVGLEGPVEHPEGCVLAFSDLVPEKRPG